MLYIPMMKGFSRIHDSEITASQSKKLKVASTAFEKHKRNMISTYIEAPVFALRMVSPFHNAIPLIPWL